MRNSLCSRVCAVTALGLFGGVVFAPAAHAQAWYDDKPGAKITVVSSEKSLLVDITARAVSAAKVIEEIALKTNMDIIISDDADIEFFAASQIPPAQAISEVAMAAGLSSELIGRTYLIRKLAGKPEKKLPALDLSFRDLPIKTLLSILKEQFAMKMEVSPDIEGELVLINLSNCTPEQAVEKIAQIAQLSLTQTKDGTLRVGFEPTIKP